MSVAALNSALLASQAGLGAAVGVVSQEVGLAGHSILASAAGFAAARYDVEAKLSNAAFMQEVRPVLEVLLPELEAEGLETSGVRDALSHLEVDLDGSINSDFWIMKLATTLEGLSHHGVAYEKAANRIWESERFVFHSGKHAAEAKKVYQYTQNRELLASLPPYSKRYHELGVVARGGQATIYLVEELNEEGEKNGRQFVSRKIHGAESVGRFYDYAKALQVLNHPNIVGLHEVTVDNGDFIVIMEIAPGQSLKAYLEHAPPLTAEQIFNLRNQLLEALRYAWHRGIIHRDLKPNNVMMALDRISGEMLVTLLDFGMAKFKSVDSRSSSMGKGTFLYWAPEQFEGGKITEATDIYQMGLVLLDLVRGHSGQKGMRDKTILEKDPLAEVAEQRALHADDPAIQKVLDQIEVMCHRDPKARMKILGMLGVPAVELTDAQDEAMAEAEAEVEVIAPSSEIEVDSEEVPPSLALDLYADISAESAMAMVDQRPPRWLYPRKLTWITSLGALSMAGMGAPAFFLARPGHEIEGVVIGMISFGFAAIFGTMPLWNKGNRRKPEKILRERAIKTLTHIFETTDDEELRISAAKALIETDKKSVVILRKAFEVFKKGLNNPKTWKAAVWGLGEMGLVGNSVLEYLFFRYSPSREEYFLILDALKRKYPTRVLLYAYLFNKEEDPSLYEKLTDPDLITDLMVNQIMGDGRAGGYDIFLHWGIHAIEVYRRIALLAVRFGKIGNTELLEPLSDKFNEYVLNNGSPTGLSQEQTLPMGEAILQVYQSVGGGVGKNYLRELFGYADEKGNYFWMEKIHTALAAIP